MIRSLTFALAVFCSSFLSFSTFAFDIDSSEDSSIDFLSMEATLSSKIVHFKWQVEAESNGDYFIIEKSIDQENWVEIKRVQSIENHKDRHTYEISEINFAEGVQEFFRILRVDEYGAISELDRVDINQPVYSNMLLIPVAKKLNSDLNVSFDSLISSKGVLRVYNIDGEVLIEQKLDQSEGYNRTMLSIKSLVKGAYRIVIEDDFGNTISKSLTIHGSKKSRRKF